VCGQPAPPAAAPLPQTADVIASVANNPIVSDIIATVKAIFSAKAVQTVGEAGKRTDIMWLILAIIEVIICGWATVFGVLQAIVYTYNQESRDRTTYREVVDGLKEYLDVSTFELYLNVTFTYVVEFAVLAALLLATMAICKKKANFGNVCNMMAVAFIPYTALLGAAAILCMIYPTAALLVVLAALIVQVVLVYQGMQSLDSFEAPPFWSYTVYYVVSTAVAAYITNRIVEDYLDSILGRLF
jgi:hypothetical protein